MPRDFQACHIDGHNCTQMHKMPSEFHERGATRRKGEVLARVLAWFRWTVRQLLIRGSTHPARNTASIQSGNRSCEEYIFLTGRRKLRDDQTNRFSSESGCIVVTFHVLAYFGSWRQIAFVAEVNYYPGS